MLRLLHFFSQDFFFDFRALNLRNLIARCFLRVLSVCVVSETLADELEKPLSRKQAQFVAEYLVDLNATQAAIRAGYSSKTAQSQASQLLQLPNVAEAVERAKAQRSARVNIKQDDILHEVSALAMSRIDHYVVDDDGNVQLAEGAPDNALAAIESIKRRKTTRTDKESNESVTTWDVEIKLYDKPGQLKLLGRHIGLFPDKVEHTGRGGGPIETVTRIEQVIVDPKEPTS